jgi:hypothetical protein
MPTVDASVVDAAAALVKECLADGRLDAGEILRIGIFVAEKVNAVKGLSGPEKKVLVLALLQKAVEAAVPVEQREQVGYTVAVQVLPAVLDIAVAAAHGKVALQRVHVGCVWNCLSSLWARRETPVAALALVSKTALELPTHEVPNLESAPPLETKDTTLLKESPKEPSPQASPEESPLEIRPPEAAAIELPNTATLTLAPVLEE